MSTTTATLRDCREAVVREHMESENVHDFDTTIGTFEHPRYEIIPTGQVFDGEEQVRGYFTGVALGVSRPTERAARSPHRRRGDQRVRSPRHASRTAARIPPTGKTFRCPMTAFFFFEGDRIVCERVYFDSATILRQLGLMP
jgi:ketosteroid isomerase-like protein